jgi:uncharacterized protein (DUF433 family)
MTSSWDSGLSRHDGRALVKDTHRGFADATWLITPAPDPTLAPMDYSQIITIEPGKRGGKPCIRGMRISFYDVLEYLASGMTAEEILSDFPDLTQQDIRACMAFAADRERRLLSISAK